MKIGLYANNLRTFLNKNKLDQSHIKDRRESLTTFVEALNSKNLSRSLLIKEILPSILKSEPGYSPEKSIRELADASAPAGENGDLEEMIISTIGQFPDKKIAYQKGKKGLLGFFMGQVMRQLKQKANPKDIQQIILKHLNDQS